MGLTLIGKNRKQGGFTLIEVLVSIAILGFTIPALMLLMMGQTDGVGVLRDKTIANWIAENKAVELRLIHQLTGTPINREQRDNLEMAGAKWYIGVDIKQTFEGTLIQYQITVGLNPDNSLMTLETYLNN